MGDLPKGWSYVNLEGITLINPRHSTSLDSSLTISFVPMSGVSDRSWKFNFTETRALGEVRNGFTHFAEGDVLIAKITPSMENGKAALAQGLTNGLGCGTTELHVLRPQCGIESKYIYYFIHQESFRKEAAQNMTGTAGQLRVPADFIKRALIPLPPLNEQHRIVAKLEKLLSKVDECKERLEKIPTILKRFRQSVLSAACSGRLTADWREKNFDVESAGEMLRRINKSHRDKSKQFDKSFNEIISSDLPDIPDTWRWERLVNISNIQGGVTKGRKLGNRKTIMLPYLRVANVQDGFLDLREIKEIEVLPEDLEKYHLEYGDLLFTEGGDRDKLGRGTVWRNNIKDCIHQNHIFRARLYHSDLSPEYISIATKSDYAKAYFFNNASQTVNLASINLTTLGKVPLATPPLPEQQEIVRRVEALFKVADRIEERYRKAKGYVDKLTQSILAKAFRGELVPQDPNGEPASVLLERIREERGKRQDRQNGKTKSRKGKQGQKQLEMDI